MNSTQFDNKTCSSSACSWLSIPPSSEARANKTARLDNWSDLPTHQHGTCGRTARTGCKAVGVAVLPRLRHLLSCCHVGPHPRHLAGGKSRDLGYLESLPQRGEGTRKDGYLHSISPLSGTGPMGMDLQRSMSPGLVTH